MVLVWLDAVELVHVVPRGRRTEAIPILKPWPGPINPSDNGTLSVKPT